MTRTGARNVWSFGLPNSTWMDARGSRTAQLLPSSVTVVPVSVGPASGDMPCSVGGAVDTVASDAADVWPPTVTRHRMPDPIAGTVTHSMRVWSTTSKSATRYSYPVGPKLTADKKGPWPSGGPK